MRKLLQDLRRMMSCEESSHLASDSLDRELTTRERLIIGMHQIMCWPCRRFVKQIAFVREALKRRAEGPGETLESPELSPAARDRIASRISHEFPDESEPT